MERNQCTGFTLILCKTESFQFEVYVCESTFLFTTLKIPQH